MFFIIGFVIVFGSVLGGYLPHGDIAVLIQPFEVLIIVGGAIGAFIIANPKPVLSATAKSFGRVLKGSPYKKEAYVELLTLQYSIFRLAKSKGMLALEAHVEDPHASSLFQDYPNFMANQLLNATTEEQKRGISEYFTPAAVSLSTGGADGMLGGQALAPGASVSATSSAPVIVEISAPPPPPSTETVEKDADEEALESGRKRVGRTLREVQG